MDRFLSLLAGRLGAAGCRRPDIAAGNLARLAPDADSRAQLEQLLPALLVALGQIPDPDLALNNLERFGQAVLDRRFLLALFRDHPRVLHLACTIFGSSQFLSDVLVRHPQLFDWLLEPGVVRQAKRKEELAEELFQDLRAVGPIERAWSTLRRYKAQQILRIGLQDLLGHQGVVGITEELSNLADVVLEAAYRFCRADLVARHGRPEVATEDGSRAECPFVVLGMGKLGGRELNFSSDIDLVFVYGAEGETAGSGPDGGRHGRVSNQEFFRKLGESLVKGLSQASPDGHVYRVDLRLRPEGRTGAIAASLRMCEMYYEAWGQTWERQALIKARPVAGDLAFGDSLLRLLTPFVYRQSLDYAALDEIRAMKERINLAVAQDRRARRNVKLGYGGIREIEFLVQGLQLLQGGRNPWVREANTLRALHRLAGQGLLADSDYELLVRAYTFLRQLEHRLQIQHDRQTHTLPEDQRDLVALARRMGYGSRGEADPAAALLADYERHTRAVRGLYDSFLAGLRAAENGRAEEPEDALQLFFSTDLSAESLRPRLAAVGFEDLERALRNFQAIREGQPFSHYSPEVRQALARLAPALVEALGRVADPDFALTTFERFLPMLAQRTTVMTTLADRPGLLELLVCLFGTSEFLSATLLRHPDLLDALLAPEPAAARGREQVRQELARALAQAGSGVARLDALRRIKKAEELRIGLQDVLGRCDVTETHRVLTELAEACLEAALQLAARELAERHGEPKPAGAVIVGMGKLGGGELGYASDLDLFLVFGADGRSTGPESLTHAEYFSKLADRINKILTSITQEGAAYRVDVRLRPGGQKGELAVSLAGLEAHFARLADLWERQAYIKARPVAGDPAVAAAFVKRAHAFVYEGPDEPDLAARIVGMRRRMESERAGVSARSHVKLGSGGIADIEFLVQYLQLRHGRADPSLRTPSTLQALARLDGAGLLHPEHCGALTDSYRFLRRVENRLRIVADLSINTLPSSPAKLEKLARRMGYRKGDRPAHQQLLADYEAHTSRVRGLFNQVLGAGE
jgi:glutamate-ammonia-ligase adenylyltransferase